MTVGVIQYRVVAFGEDVDFHVVKVADDGTALTCDCLGWRIGKFCRHVDAVLVHGERAMVHPEDFEAADAAMALIGDRIVPPADWKGTWRADRGWRGLSRKEMQRNQARAHDGGKPLVCFTGKMPRERSEMRAEALAHGWAVTDEPSKFTDVLVAADPLARNRKLNMARQHSTPIVDPDEWLEVMTDGVLPAQQENSQ